MISVKFVGGAKKSFLTDKLQVDKANISIQELLDLLLKLQPDNTPILDLENILIAVNGSDSSAMGGNSTVLKENDDVSIIPLIHGGSSKRLVFKILNKKIQTIEIKGETKTDVSFLDDLRKKYPKILLQAVSTKFILNSYHFKKILNISLESYKNNILLSNKLETDILMRFALSGQISNAILNAGIKPKNNFLLIAIGNQRDLDSLYEELSSVSVQMFSKDNSTFLKKHFKITKKHIDSVYSKYPLEEILIEKAVVLF